MTKKKKKVYRLSCLYTYVKEVHLLRGSSRIGLIGRGGIPIRVISQIGLTSLNIDAILLVNQFLKEVMARCRAIVRGVRLIHNMVLAIVRIWGPQKLLVASAVT